MSIIPPRPARHLGAAGIGPISQRRALGVTEDARPQADTRRVTIGGPDGGLIQHQPGLPDPRLTGTQHQTAATRRASSSSSMTRASSRSRPTIGPDAPPRAPPTRQP